MKHGVLTVLGFYLVEQHSELLAKCLQLLPAFRQEQVARYQHELARRNGIVSYLLLKRGLEEHFDLLESVEFTYNTHGKPYLKNHPQVFFNISHCKHGVVCALADFEIGVDIQDVRAYDEALARKVCSASELVELMGTGNPDLLFCRMWAARESHAKAQGIGVIQILQHEIPRSNTIQWDFDGYCLALSGDRADMSPVIISLQTIDLI